MVTIAIEGQTIELPDTLGVSDDQIRRAIAPIFPQVTTAQLTRTTDTQGHTVITVAKQAAPKGHLDGILTHLKKATRHVNPVFPYYRRLVITKEAIKTPENYFAMQRQLRVAIDQGEEELRQTTCMLRRLIASSGHASNQVPLGF